MSPHTPFGVSALLVAGLALAPTPTISAGGVGSGYCHTTPISPDTLIESDLYGGAFTREGNLAAVRAAATDAVHVYELVDSTWTLLDTIENPSEPASSFGRSMDICGDRIAVGAYGNDELGQNAGRAYLYERVGDEFALVETFVDEFPEEGGFYGSRVALTPGWLAISAPGTGVGGAVHVYLELAGGWTLVDEIPSPGTGFFGSALALHEREPLEVVLFVGDLDDDTLGPGDGVVRHYRVTPAMTQMHSPAWPSGVTANGGFGNAVEYDGERLIVAAEYDNETGQYAGAVYVFESPVDSGDKVLLEKMLPTAVTGFDRFGFSIDFDGERIAVGAPGQGVIEGSGAVHIFAPGLFGGGFELEDIVEPADPQEIGRFGGKVELDGDSVLVGCAGYDNSLGVSDTGALYHVSLASSGGLTGQCPCDDLASYGSYGEGKAGSLGVPLLETSLPVPGGYHTLQVSNVPIGTTPFLLWGTAATEIPFDGGALLVAAPHFTVMPMVGVLGQVGVGWLVPFANPALCGVQFYAQAMLVDPGAEGEYQTAQTNGVRMTIGF